MSDTKPRTGDAVDGAIDRAVRRIMSAEPPPGLRRRVLARLDAPAPRAALFPRLAVGATFAMIVLAVFLYRPSREPRPAVAIPMAPIVTSTPPRGEPARAAASAEPARIAAPLPPPGTVTRERIPMPRITNVFGNRNARAEAASASSGDVVFAPEPDAALVPDLPGAVPPIQIPQIVIAPLQVERLHIDQPARK